MTERLAYKIYFENEGMKWDMSLKYSDLGKLLDYNDMADFEYVRAKAIR